MARLHGEDTKKYRFCTGRPGGRGTRIIRSYPREAWDLRRLRRVAVRFNAWSGFMQQRRLQMLTCGSASSNSTQRNHRRHITDKVTQQFSEKQMRRIYWENCLFEDRAEVKAGVLRNEDEAQQEVSSGQVVLGDDGRYSEGKAAQKLPELLKRKNEIEDKYHQQLCRKYHMTEQKRQAIVNEGAIQHWPLPTGPQ